MKAITGKLIPQPQSISQQSSVFQLTAQTALVVPDSVNIPKAIKMLNSEIQRLGRFVPEVCSQTNAVENVIIFRKEADKAEFTKACEQNGLEIRPSDTSESYWIEVSEQKIEVKALQDAGLFYGAMTLVQLLNQNAGKLEIPCLTIVDWPAMPLRGVTDDMSRGQVSTLDNLKKIVRFLAQYKMNAFMPYLEDLFTFSKHPLIGKDRGAFTKAEMVELQDYAAGYFVEIIPIFQTLGHYENILNLPEYIELAEYPGAQSFEIGNERVYQLLEELLDEIIPVFRSKYFHIGADESWDVGHGKNRENALKHGLAKVHAEHYQRVFEMVKKHNKTILMYGDIILDHPEVLKYIPDDVIMFDWHYGAETSYPSLDVFKKSGKPFMVSPAVSNWNRIFTDNQIATVNIQHFVQQGYAMGARGALNSNWGDYGGANLRELCYYGYAFGADCSWNPQQADVTRFEQAFCETFYGTNKNTLLKAFSKMTEISKACLIHEIWQPPFLQLNKNDENELEKEKLLLTNTAEIQDLLQQATTEVTKNRDHLAVLDVCNQMVLWLGKKIALVNWFKQHRNRFEKADTATKSALCLEGIEKANALISQLSQFQINYSKCWVSTNKPDNLNKIMFLLDRQAAYLRDLIARLELGVFWQDREISSKWLAFPKKEATAPNQPKVYFKKELELDAVPLQAALQLAAVSMAKLSINNREVGTVFARRSNSLTVDLDRVKMWDIQSFLQPGKNLIEIEAVNFEGFKSAEDATINCFIFLELNAGQAFKIKSNESWQASLDKKNWQEAAPIEAPFFLVEPCLKSYFHSVAVRL